MGREEEVEPVFEAPRAWAAVVEGEGNEGEKTEKLQIGVTAEIPHGQEADGKEAQTDRVTVCLLEAGRGFPLAVVRQGSHHRQEHAGEAVVDRHVDTDCVAQCRRAGQRRGCQKNTDGTSDGRAGAHKRVLERLQGVNNGDGAGEGKESRAGQLAGDGQVARLANQMRGSFS